MGDAAHRSRVLTLFREFLRAGKSMPTPFRREYIRARARRDFREQKLAPVDQRDFLVSLGDTLLDQARAQAEVLRKNF
jgi:hypothetical protein